MKSESSPLSTEATPEGRGVFDVLSASHARLERSATLGDGLRLAQWHKHDEATTYVAPGHHTISVYLSGGFGTHVAHRPSVKGSPGRLCVLPAEHESHWVVTGTLGFLHLYISDTAWAERVVRLLDAEPRAVTLDAQYLVEDNRMAQWARAVAGQEWASTDARLKMNGLSHAALDQLVLDAARPVQRNAALRPQGGLSVVARRRVIDWIEANLHERFTLSDLAAQAALSEFHFARMFRVSMGVTPHAWVAQRRFARACALLSRRTGAPLPLESVASACGYANASHLNHRFHEELGVTPARLRRLARG